MEVILTEDKLGIDDLAIKGGLPIRKNILNYGRQTIDLDDIKAIVHFLGNSNYLTSGPTLKEFENVISQTCGSNYVSVVSNGTTALHLAMVAIGIKEDTEVIIPAISFIATANCILQCGGRVVFADIDDKSLLININSVISKITDKTKAIIIVDMCGTPAPYQQLWDICKEKNIYLVIDASHSYGVKIPLVGSYGDLTIFSFDQFDNITTGEGGAIATNNLEFDIRIKKLRNHGIEEHDTQQIHINELGYNYKLTDIQASIGINQNKKIDYFIEMRNNIANIYDAIFNDKKLGLNNLLEPLQKPDGHLSAYHFYIILLNLENLKVDRDTIYKALIAEGIGCGIHYIPVYYHQLYKEKGYLKGLCPNAEKAYDRIITLPCFPLMTDDDQKDVIRALKKVLDYYKK